MGQLNLPVRILQKKRFRSLQHPQLAPLEPGCVPTRLDPLPARLHPHQPHVHILQECIKDPNRVAAPAYAGADHIRQPLLPLHQLGPCFLPDHPVKFPDHVRVRMRPVSRPEDVVGGANIGYPITHRLVDRLF